MAVGWGGTRILRDWRLWVALAGTVAVMLAVAWLPVRPVQAAGVRYVIPAPLGNDAGNSCDSPNTPCATIQRAVDVATAGDEIRLATATYREVATRTIGRAIAAIQKPITLRGGYTLANFQASNPSANPTILDAEGKGRALVIANASVTIAGLRITRGEAAGLGGGPEPATDAGGGIFVNGGSISLDDVTVTRNSGGFGAGVYVTGGPATVTASRFDANEGSQGAGLFLNSANGSAINGSSFTANSAVYGAGLYLSATVGTLTGNSLIGNVASGAGGGLLLKNSAAMATSTTVDGNSAVSGGGIYLDHADGASLANTFVIRNSATFGGGIYLYQSAAGLVNPLVADNAGGITVDGGVARIQFATIARNTNGSNTGLTAYNGAVAWITNTIVVSQAVGLNVDAGSGLAADAILYFGNGANTAGGGVVQQNGGIVADPRFDVDGYHLTAGSPAIDKGVFGGAAFDIDGGKRPSGLAPDLGVDEFGSTTDQAGRIRQYFVPFNAQSASSRVLRYVSPFGDPAASNPCTNSANPCKTIQQAVDVSVDNDEIRVANGTYSDLTTVNDLTQMVYLTKSVAIIGGYTRENFVDRDYQRNQTNLDAGGKGRLFYIAGPSYPYIDGFILRNGTAAENGGAVFVNGATATLRNTLITGSTAKYGAGVYLYESSATLLNNTFSGNRASETGGGLMIVRGGPGIYQNTFDGNSATINGGGLFLEGSDTAVIQDNAFRSNAAGQLGGGADLRNGKLNLSYNGFAFNTSGRGAALAIKGASGTIRGFKMGSNQASAQGGAMFLDSSSGLSIVETSITNNIGGSGGGIYVYQSTVSIVNTVINNNGGGIAIDGGNVSLVQATLRANESDSKVAIDLFNGGALDARNVIIALSGFGVQIQANSFAQIQGVLWFGNGQNVAGAGGSSVTRAVTGDPLVKEDGYHLGEGSPAVDVGINSGVGTDIDGQKRPQGAGYDLGADELTPA